MKKMLILGLAGAGAAYYLIKNKSAAKNPQAPGSNAKNYSPANPNQPSQKYPFQPITPPRVDTANQPWYNGILAAVGVGSGPNQNYTTGGQSVALSAQAGQSVVHSVADIWGMLSGSGAGPSASPGSAAGTGANVGASSVGTADDPESDAVGNTNPSVVAGNVGGQGYDQSNSVGTTVNSYSMGTDNFGLSVMPDPVSSDTTSPGGDTASGYDFSYYNDEG